MELVILGLVLLVAMATVDLPDRCQKVAIAPRLPHGKRHSRRCPGLG